MKNAIIITGNYAGRTFTPDEPLPDTAGRATRLECRCKLLRHSDRSLLDVYDTFFTAADLKVVPVDEAVIERATDFRARFNVKTPDAIHLASAFVSGASTFLTGDRDLARCRDVSVELV